MQPAPTMQELVSRLKGLHTDDHIKILNAIDHIRRQGTGEYVALPQIVVCGDQSSGKSAVLEAISGVSFPVKHGTCTRFVTELSLRHASMESGSVRIIPGPNASEEYKARLEGFVEENITLPQVGEYIERAKECIIFPKKTTISKDKLLVEVRAPELQPLTLIDLPGFIHFDDEDDKSVRDLANSYLQEPRSIILAIVQATGDIKTQEVIKVINTLDPTGKRTIGVIPKPDLMDNGHKDAFSLLARNETTRLQRGWHVVRNRGSEEDRSSFDQTREEDKIFENEPWKSLSPAQRGIMNLRTRLSKLLLEETCKHLEPVITEVEDQIKKCSTELNKLGNEKGTLMERRHFLTEIREKFRARVYDGVEGHYANTYYEQHLNQRLRAKVRRLNDEFDQIMHSHGHKYHINRTMGTAASEPCSAAEAPKVISAVQFLEDIDQSVVQLGRAKELPGRYNPALVATVFRKQSIKWKHIAWDYARSVSYATEKFLAAALEGTADKQITRRIWTGLVQPRLQIRQKALEAKVEELLKPFTEFLPFSTPRRYGESLKRYAELRTWLEKVGEEKATVKDPAACADLLVAMLAYYNSAMETFIDNMISLAVESCLLHDLSNILTTDVFSKMEDKDLQKYSEESEEIVMRRDELTKKQNLLQDSLNTFKDRMWELTTSLTAPSGFSLGLIPGDNDSIDSITDQMSAVQLPLLPQTPTQHSRAPTPHANEYTDQYQTTSRTSASPTLPPVAARTSSPSMTPSTTSSSLRPSAVPSTASNATSDSSRPSIKNDSPPTSFAAPDARDWRNGLSLRRPSSSKQRQVIPTLQVEDEEEEG